MENQCLPLKILWLQVPDELTCFICRRLPMLWLKLPPASSIHFLDLGQHQNLHNYHNLGSGPIQGHSRANDRIFIFDLQ